MLADFNWMLHIWTIPLTVLVGFILGWGLRGFVKDQEAERSQNGRS